MLEELVAPGMNATEPLVLLWHPPQNIASPKEEQEKEQEYGNGYGMVLLC